MSDQVTRFQELQADNRAMKVYLNEIKELEQNRSFDEKSEWVSRAVTAADEFMPDQSSQRSKARPQHLQAMTEKNQSPRSIDCKMSWQKVDDVYVINGKINSTIHLLCSRCTQPVIHPVDKKFCALFTQDAALTGLTGSAADDKRTVGHAHSQTELLSTSSGYTDTADEILLLKEKFIDLEEVLREQFLLQVPYAPLCQPECKGLCPQCGSDLNIGRCACKNLKPESPFKALQALGNRATEAKGKPVDKSVNRSKKQGRQ